MGISTRGREGCDIHYRWGGRRYPPEAGREEISTRDEEGRDIKISVVW